MKNAKHILKTALFCGVIALLPLVSVLGPRENTSFYENRTLAAFPAFSRASLLDGSFFSGAEDYISDHIAFRIPLLRLNVRKELVLHDPVISDTVVEIGRAHV